MENCPCGSGISFQECCGPMIKGERKAKTALELLRSRYTAYAKAEVDYILATTHPAQRSEGDEKTVRDWAKSAVWHGLDIMQSNAGGENDDEGQIEFTARYTEKNISEEHHELAFFKKDKGDWYFYDARMLPHKPFVRTEAKVGRNDPCTCGSGKKYKKCCGS